MRVRRVGSLAVLVALFFGGLALAPAHADEDTHVFVDLAPCRDYGRTMRAVHHGYVWVDARSRGVPVVTLYAGQKVSLVANGRMWAGVWFTGENGPEGWPGWRAPNNGQWAAPGADQYSLVMQQMPWSSGLHNWNDPAYTAVGRSVHCVPSQGFGLLNLATNDSWFADNTGGFSVEYYVWA